MRCGGTRAACDVAIIIDPYSLPGNLKMPAGRICLADSLQHRLVLLLHVNSEIARVAGPRNLRFVDVVDGGGNQYEIVISDNMGLSRRTRSKLAKLANGIRGVARPIEAYGPVEIFP